MSKRNKRGIRCVELFGFDQWRPIGQLSAATKDRMWAVDFIHGDEDKAEALLRSDLRAEGIKGDDLTTLPKINNTTRYIPYT